MDLATLIGLLAGMGVMVGAIFLGGSVEMFFNVPSLVVVIGGTFATVMMKFSMGQFIGAVKVAMKAFMHKEDDLGQLIEDIENMANTARKEGLLALEGVDVSNEFLKKGIQMMVDGHTPEMVRGVLKKDMDNTIVRHEVGQKIFKGFGDYAPAMGMIGTLIGLVQMLANMSDPKAIGPAMAVALLTTLYGAMIANMIALPISDKLALRSGEEKKVKALILDGLSGIQAGHNPRMIQEVLATYLPKSKRKVDDQQ